MEFPTLFPGNIQYKNRASMGTKRRKFYYNDYILIHQSFGLATGRGYPMVVYEWGYIDSCVHE